MPGGRLDAGVSHDRGDPPVGGCPRSEPEGIAGSLRRPQGKRVDEFVGGEIFAAAGVDEANGFGVRHSGKPRGANLGCGARGTCAGRLL